MAKLYLMLGYPGAGKTTVAEHIHHLTGAVHLSSDKIRLELFPKPTFSEEEHAALYAEIDRRTHDLLAVGEDVIYDANLNRYVHRKEKYDICQQTGATPQLIWVKTATELAKERATVLGVNDPDRRPFGNLDGAVFDRLASEIEPPTQGEKPIVIDGQNVSRESVAVALGIG